MSFEAQDRCTLKAANGIASWPDVAVSEVEDGVDREDRVVAEEEPGVAV
jgi:hypothetical protein